MTNFDYFTFISVLSISIPLTLAVIAVFESQGK
jgi:hypothetical protein